MAYANTSFADGAGHGLISRVRAQFAAYAERAYRRSIYYGTARALSQLSDRQLADISIARSEITRIAKEAAYGA